MPPSCSHPHGPDAAGLCLLCGLRTGAPRPGACGACGARRDGGRFCEACGHPDGSDPAAAGPQAGWTALISTDAERFAASGAVEQGVEFPGAHEYQVELAAASLRIGRRSRREPSAPDIDLTGPPTDPGVSRRHARLLWHDRGWTLIDLGSANGTYVNASTTPVSKHRPVLLATGDRIGLGLWTRITVTHRG